MSESSSELSKAASRWTLTRAPGFELPGTTGGGDRAIHQLIDYTREGVTVVGFYGYEELDAAAPLSWLQCSEEIDVLVVSDAGCSKLVKTATNDHLVFPLLGDPSGNVADKYGANYEDEETGRVVLIDSSDRIRRTWEDGPDAMTVYDAALELLESESNTPQRGAD